jgi:hypothetical protein
MNTPLSDVAARLEGRFPEANMREIYDRTGEFIARALVPNELTIPNVPQNARPAPFNDPTALGLWDSPLSSWSQSHIPLPQLTKAIFVADSNSVAEERALGVSTRENISPRLVVIDWQGPEIFQGQPEMCDELPDFVALMEVRYAHDVIGLDVDRLQNLVQAQCIGIGALILQAFQHLLMEVLRNDERLITYDSRLGNLECFFEATPTKLLMVTVGPDTECERAIQCLEWIDNVIGSPEEKGLWKKERQVVERRDTLESAKSKPHNAWWIRHLEIITQHSHIAFSVIHEFYYGKHKEVMVPEVPPYDLCWTSLFDRGFVGSFSSTGESPHIGKGLRMPFQVMASLAGIERVIEWDHGLVLTGFSSALVPINVLHDGSVQWHMMVAENVQSPFRAIEHREGFWENIPKARLMATTLDSIQGTAYLGWVESIQVTLGTNDPSIALERSSLPSITTTWTLQKKGIQLGGQLGFGGSISLYAQYIRNRGKLSTVCRFPIPDNFGTKVNALYSAKVFIHDDDRKTTWLCPTIHLIIFMLRVYLNGNKYSPVDKTALLFPNGLDGSRTEIKQLESKPIQDNLTETYGDVLSALAFRYSYAFGTLRDVGHSDSPDSLIGFELLDIIGNDSNFSARRLAVNDSIRSWSILVGKDDFAFCKYLGEPMVPDRATQISPCAVSPPSGSDILVSPVCLLQDKFNQFLETSAIKTGDTAYRWSYRGTPFNCSSKAGVPCNGRCWADRLQLVTRSARTLKIFGLPKSNPLAGEFGQPIPLSEAGAVCFGVDVQPSDLENYLPA